MLMRRDNGGKHMPSQVVLVIILNFIIYIIATLAYSVRIVGVRTGKIAISFSVFNIFALISRTANSIQAPVLAKTIENTIKTGNPQSLIYSFRWILFSTTIATITGALLMPSFIKIFTRLVESFSIYRSIPKLLIHGFSKAGVEQFKISVTKPKRENIKQLKNFKNMPKRVILLNVIAASISTVGVLASLYAGCLSPDLRSTCGFLSSIINGIATVMMFIFIDPYVSMLTDDVIRGNCTELQFNRCIIFIVAGLIVGTLLAQILLIPAAHIIVFTARMI
jgi:hypothetical protein